MHYKIIFVALLGIAFACQAADQEGGAFSLSEDDLIELRAKICLVRGLYGILYIS